jgi:5-methylcytosine-specific restriction endonuclease McrA
MLTDAERAEHARESRRRCERSPEQRAKQKARRAANREVMAAYLREYRRVHAVEVRQKEHTRSAERWRDPVVRAYYREYARLHPQHARNSWHRYRARKLGAIVKKFDEAGTLAAVRAIGVCAYCLAECRPTVDHVVPLLRGGVHAPENLVPACKGCNSRKGTALIEPLFYPIGAAPPT